jgi:hypothetical protein
MYNCLFSIRVQFYLPLPSGENAIAVNKYNIIILKWILKVRWEGVEWIFLAQGKKK